MSRFRILGVVLSAALAGAGCAEGPEAAPAAPGGPAAPARTIGAPEIPHAPPAMSPHTRVDTAPAMVVSAEPTAGTWKSVLYAPADTAVAPPPTGEALAADQKQAADIRAGSAAEWARTADWWSAGAVRRWNEIARELIGGRHVNSGNSARILGALAVAQYDAAIASRRLAEHYALKTADPARLADLGRGIVEQYGYPSQEAAIARASADLLAHFFTDDALFLKQNELAHSQSRIWMGAAMPSDVEAGRTLGRAASAAAIAWLDADNFEQVLTGRVSQQPDKWFSEEQIFPGFGKIKPWVMRSGDQFRAPVPPAVGSPEFAAALEEIRTYSDRLSAEQLAIAQYWNLGVGGPSVPGMWDQVALQLAATAGYSEPRTARMLALLNMAMMDACIASWDTKYHYVVPRPSMRDRAIREPLGLPAHPSYTSGHSAFSGAAEGIISAIFPDAAEEMHRLAEEASASRWYGGIHYRFDGDAGLRQGREIAAWVLSERGANDGAPPFRAAAGRNSMTSY